MGSGSTQTLLTPTIIAREALRLLKNNLVMGNLVYRAYEAEFPGEPKKGGTVTIRKPVKFTVTKAKTRATSYITEHSITLTVATQAHVSWAFSSKDLTLSIEEYSERYIRPAAAVLANTVDADLCALYDDVYNYCYESTGFVNPNTFMVMGKAMQLLDEEAAPPDDRVIVLNPAGHWSMSNALSNWNFAEGGAQALRKGRVGRIANAEIYMDQNIKTHTTGVCHDSGSTNSDVVHVASAAGDLPTGAVLNTSNRSMKMIDFKVVNTQVLKVGDVFEINNVYAVNPMSGESTGSRRKFVVTADCSVGVTETTSGGFTTVSFEPAIVNTGPYKTVDTIPAVNSIVYLYWSENEPYPQNLAFHKNAFALVMVPLAKPEGVPFSSSVTEDGVSCRIVKDYDINEDDEIIRLDILYGVKTIYPELAVRIFGAEG